MYIRQRGTEKKRLIQSFRPHKRHVLLKFEGIDSVEQAGELVGLELGVREEQLPEPEERTFYQYQLIGCRVTSVHGDEVGEVEGIFPAGENEVLVVRMGGREVLIPFTEAVCPRIDTEKKEILIDPPDGLLEIDEI